MWCVVLLERGGWVGVCIVMLGGCEVVEAEVVDGGMFDCRLCEWLDAELDGQVRRMA